MKGISGGIVPSGKQPTKTNKENPMKKVTLNRNGQHYANDREVSDLKAGRFQLGEHVMLGIIDGDYGRRPGCEEFVVAKIEPCDRFGGGRETVTFERVARK